MVPAKTKAQPVGSAQWVQSERDQARQFIDQEVEEFSFSVRNELEWLDEHLGDIFSRNQMNFTDAFKTPGKLRGKTPRTARKAGAPRQPLTDIFAPNGQTSHLSAQKTTTFYDKVAQFQIAEDVENQQSQHRPTGRSKSPQRVGKPGNTDSGYHGMTEDEMENETQGANTQADSQDTVTSKALQRDEEPEAERAQEVNNRSRRPSEGSSFVSAKEATPGQHRPEEQPVQPEEHSDEATVPDEYDHDTMHVDEPQDDIENRSVAADSEEVEVAEAIDEDPADEEMIDEIVPSPSEASSPEKPLQRKSSFTFSALPAREPLTAKRSIGMRDSQMDIGRNSVFAKSLTGKSMGTAASDTGEGERGKSEEARLQSKTSTQLLQERISMLGKPKEPRTSKSIPQSVLSAQVSYPQLPTGEATGSKSDDVEMQDEPNVVSIQADDDEDDWITPVKPAQHRQLEALSKEPAGEAGSPQRPSMHQKSISASNIPSATKPDTDTAQGTRQQKAMSVSNPNLAHEYHSTTPAGSPAHKKQHDGPLSASRSRLYSVFKSARGLFASSANASAVAKLETYGPSPSRSPERGPQNQSSMSGMLYMPGAMYSEAQLPPSPSRAGSVLSALSKSPSRKTRSSTESKRKHEKELKAQQKAEQELEKVREKERQTAAKQREEEQREEERKAAEAEAARQEKERLQAAAQADRPASAEGGQGRGEDMPPPPPPKSMLPAGKLRAPGRLAKPTKEMPRSNPKPAPVNIRVASQSQRMGQPQSSTREESMPPAPPPKQERPASGLRTASAQGTVRSSTAPNNARVKALEAAARKKELEEKAAQRKAEQKRELERKRAAKAEEDRRIEQERKADEQKRAQEAKLASQRQAEKQAAEARRREQQRLEQERQRQEQQRQLGEERQYEAVQKAKAAHDLAEAIHRERAQTTTQQHPRGDVAGGTLRQLSKNMAPVQPNPAKPAKRVLQQEDEDQAHAPRPGMQRGPPSYQQQNEAKRRKTIDEDQQEQRNSVMAPPKRPSNMRKETLTKFPHGYSHAPPPASHHPSNMFKATVTAQHQLHHPSKPGQLHPSQMVQHSNARIPFAENPNPAASSHQAYPQPPPGHENGYHANKFKTPARPAPGSKQAAKSTVKSSPLYPNGDAIALPEIATDSEDEEDSEDEGAAGGGFRAPSWVASPALRELLTQQQLVDPETVFGPIGELRMEEVFKGGKNQERLKRFRDRGSSAAWVETGDAVTSAEKRRDMEMRERVVKEGGWRYEPGA